MVWQAPKTWVPGEMATAALFNQHIRDNMTFLKTAVAGSGLLISSPEGCVNAQYNATAADLELTNFGFTLPANALAKVGDQLLVEGAAYSAIGGAGTRLLKILVGGGTTTTFISTTSAAVYLIPFRLRLIRRTSVTGALTAWNWVGTGGTFKNSGLGTVNWAADQAIKFYTNFSGGTAGTFGMSNMCYAWGINAVGGTQ